MTLSELFGWSDPYSQYACGIQAQQSLNYDAMCNAYNRHYRDQGFLSQAIAPTQQIAKKADCEGCGAPLKTHIHHCEYCRRAK